jgi:hypothetical protein
MIGSRTVTSCLLVVLVTVVSYHTTAQAVQTHRYETEQKGSDEYFTVICMGNGDLTLLRERNKFNGNKRQWEVTILDTTLHEKKHFDFHIEERYPMIGYEVKDSELYLLFRTGENSKNSLVLVELNTETGSEVQRQEIKPEVDLRITHFNKAGSTFVFGGYVSNDPAILLYELSSNSLKVVPGFFQDDSELVDVRVNQNTTFNVILIDRSTRSERKLVLKTFDESGKMLLEDIIPLENEKYLQQSLTSALVREDMLIAGTWGQRTGKQSSGFFTIPVDPFNEQKINYFHFGELNHFLDYLSAKRAARIKSNTLKDIQEGKNPSFTAFVVPYKLLENKDGYYLVAEAYNPVSTPTPYYGSPYSSPYYANPYSMYNPFWPGYYPGLRYKQNSPYNANSKTAEEVKTFSTILLHFDSKGNLSWDESIKLDEIEKPTLEQISEFYLTDDDLIFLYKKESELKTKTIALGSDMAFENTQKIKLPDQLDDIRHENDNEGGVKHWIDNNFYMWGYHTIRNTSFKEDKTRDVFYINKIVVH